jgi:TatD DNase family protein
VEDDPLRSPLFPEHAQHVVVRVTVVDRQREVVLLRDADVLLERADLCRAAVLAGAEEVETGLADRPDAGQRREPLDAGEVLVETDAPFLTPMPYRGRPNAPYLIPLTMRALATVRGEDVDELCGAVATNGHRAFGYS